MLESFGARLRERREKQDITLVTVANRTKIKLSLLEALERDDVSHWPSGFYRRAFIRAYAHAIGLNTDDVVREFLDAHPDQADLAVTASAAEQEADAARTSSGPPTRLRYIVGSAIGRLRRGRAAEERVVADGPPAHLWAPPESHPALPPPEPVPVETMREVAAECLQVAELPQAVERPQVAECPHVDDAVPSDPDFLAVAQLCTEFGRVETTDDVQPLLEETARILDAVGLIVWVWDGLAGELRPVLASGYSDKVLAQLPTVRRDTDNLTAAAFRSARTCAIGGSEHARGALVAPLLTPGGCAGVLALELRQGSRQTPSFLRAAATIFAALLAQLVGGAAPTEIQQAEMIAAVRSG